MSKHRIPASHAAATVASAVSSSSAVNMLPSGAPPNPSRVISGPRRPSGAVGNVTATPSRPGT